MSLALIDIRVCFESIILFMLGTCSGQSYKPGLQDHGLSQPNLNSKQQTLPLNDPTLMFYQFQQQMELVTHTLGTAVGCLDVTEKCFWM
jgi:hypothetical protein